MGDTGSITNITTDNLNVGQLFLAACSNMADNYAMAAERIAPELGWDTLVLSGGLPQSLPRLVEMIQERLQSVLAGRPPLTVRQFSGEETLIGLMKLSKTSLNGTR